MPGKKAAAGALAESDRLFEAMKAIRALFSLEAELIAQGPSVTAAA